MNTKTMKTLTLTLMLLTACNGSTTPLPEDGGTTADAAAEEEHPAPAQCTSADTCVVPAGPCQACDDAGTVFSCPEAECREGTCVTYWPDCPK